MKLSWLLFYPKSKKEENILSLFHFSAFTIWRHKMWAWAWWRNYLIYLTFPSSVSPVLTFRKSRVLVSQNISRYIFLIPTQQPLSWKLSRTYTFFSSTFPILPQATPMNTMFFLGTNIKFRLLLSAFRDRNVYFSLLQKWDRWQTLLTSYFQLFAQAIIAIADAEKVHIWGNSL